MMSLRWSCLLLLETRAHRRIAPKRRAFLGFLINGSHMRVTALYAFRDTTVARSMYFYVECRVSFTRTLLHVWNWVVIVREEASTGTVPRDNHRPAPTARKSKDDTLEEFVSSSTHTFNSQACLVFSSSFASHSPPLRHPAAASVGICSSERTRRTH
jgi:hypothetical protein